MKPRLLYKITDADSVTADCCSDIFHNGTDSDARQIYRGARNTLYDVAAKNGRHLCVKHFRKTKFPNSYIYDPPSQQGTPLIRACRQTP